jgi:hypothetical protein
MKRRTAIIISIIVVTIFSAGGLYAYAKYFGPQTVLQTNSDKLNCRQGNVLDGVDRQIYSIIYLRKSNWNCP